MTTSFRAIVVFSLLLMVTTIGSAAELTGSRPNLILIMCDDMGWSDIGCYGSEIQTPNIDRMANEGLRFTQFYNNAKCTTTRASLVTGLYPRPKGGLLKSNMVTLGEAMKTAGYQTSLSGKWHLGSKEGQRPFDRGFDDAYGLWDGCCNFFNPSQPDPKFKGGRVRYFGHNDIRITEFPEDFYTTDAFTNHAISMVKRFAKNDAPFFMNINYTAPHYPLHAKPADIAKYQGRYDKGWDQLRKERLARQIKMGLIDPSWAVTERDPEAKSWKDAENNSWQADRMEVYAAMIDSMDQNIGRLLASLKEAGVDDNTLVMFHSDNGGCAESPGGEDPNRIPGVKEFYTTCGPGWAYAQNSPFRRYKTWMHEGGIATPLVVRWPNGVKPDTMTPQVAHIIDLLPTFLDLAGAKYPAKYAGNEILPTDGKTIAPILAGKQRDPHEYIFWEFTGNRAVRHGDMKLAWDKKVKQWELYDLKKDRTEVNDLAASKPEMVKELTGKWMAWAKETGNRVK